MVGTSSTPSRHLMPRWRATARIDHDRAARSDERNRAQHAEPRHAETAGLFFDPRLVAPPPGRDRPAVDPMCRNH